MKYLGQVLLILLFSFSGELLHSIIALPVPAAIYGLVLLFLALALKIVKVRQIKDAGHFLVDIMPLLFICPVVGLMEIWPVVRENWLPVLLITVISLLLTFLVSGTVTKLLISKRKGRDE